MVAEKDRASLDRRNYQHNQSWQGVLVQSVVWHEQWWQYAL